MDSFSYLSVFISLILGLGVTHLLTGVAAVIRSRRELKLWWPTPLWIATTFLIQVQTWWAMFTLRKVEHWSFAAFLVVLLQPVAIFMMAALIVPRTVNGHMIDLKEEYFREFRWFFSALLLALAASLGKIWCSPATSHSRSTLRRICCSSRSPLRRSCPGLRASN